MKNSTTLQRDPFATLLDLTSTLSRSATPAPAAEPTVSTPVRRSLLDRLDTWLWRMRQRELEQALARATDVADLERRLVDQVGPFGRYY